MCYFGHIWESHERHGPKVQVYREKFNIVFLPKLSGEFLYMYGSQEKILGQKVDVKFFTVGPYVPLALVRQTILKKMIFGKMYFFLNQQKTKPSPKLIP